MIEKLRAQIRNQQKRIQVLQHTLKVSRAREHEMFNQFDVLFEERPQTFLNQSNADDIKFDGISFIICAYNIEKQLIRTLKSLSPSYQNAPRTEIEVIIVDNGSRPKVSLEGLKKYPFVSQVIHVEGKPSPVFAMNNGIEAAKFSNIALMIDGAHILSPGVFRNAKSIFQSMPNPVISVPPYHLGEISQNLFQPIDVFQKEEEKLRELNWPVNGYSLFDYAVKQGEGITKNSLNDPESNCLITTRKNLDRLGAFEEHFDEPGAGLANLEIFTRLSMDTENDYVILFGEGSFHQNHGGVTTNISPEERDEKVKQYFDKFEKLLGHRVLTNYRSPFLYGTVRKSVREVTIISSAFMKAKQKILVDLSKLYLKYAKAGNLNPESPHLSLEKLNSALLPDLLQSKVVKGDTIVNLLKKLHLDLKPKFYFQSGVQNGLFLNLCRCQSVVCGDPNMIAKTVPFPTRIFIEKASQFFGNEKRLFSIFSREIDLAFLSAPDLAENLIQQIGKLEAFMSKSGAMVLGNVCPDHIEMTHPKRSYRQWAGTAYKIIPLLAKYRPDLEVQIHNTYRDGFRYGTAVLTNLDPTNTFIKDNLDSLLIELSSMKEASSIEQVEKIVDLKEVGFLVKEK